MSDDTLKIVALAAVGIGVYYVLKKRAAPVAPGGSAGLANPYTPQNPLQDLAARIAGSLAGKAVDSIGSSWSTSQGGNNPSAYVASSAIDGAAYNPTGNVSPYDAGYTMPADLAAFDG